MAVLGTCLLAAGGCSCGRSSAQADGPAPLRDAATDRLPDAAPADRAPTDASYPGHPEEDWAAALDVPWGDVMRIRYAGKDLPGNGAPGDPFGVFRTAYYSPDTDGKFALMGGDTYYAVMEFGSPVRAKVLLAYGNATQPGSKHVGDQLELFAKQQMRDPWRTRKDIEANVESREEIR